MQIFLTKLKPNRYENISNVFRVVKAIWRMEKSKQRALSLLQYFIEINCRIVVKQIRGRKVQK